MIHRLLAVLYTWAAHRLLDAARYRTIRYRDALPAREARRRIDYLTVIPHREVEE